MAAPGVIAKELDISDRVPSFPGVYGFVQIRARKGPLGPRLMTSESQLLKTYTPDEKFLIGYDLAYFSATTYLQSSDKLWVNRVVPSDAKNAGLALSVDSKFEVDGRDVDETFAFADGEMLLLASANPGDWGNDIAVKVYSYADEPGRVKEPNAFILEVYKRANLNQPVEVHLCSMNPGHLDGFNRNIYIENVLRASLFLQAFVNPANDWEANPYPFSVGYQKNGTGGPSAAPLGTPEFLKSGDDGSLVTSGEMIQGLEEISNADEYPLTLIMDGGFTTPAYQQELVALAEKRTDSVALLSMPFEVQQNANYLNDMIDYRNGAYEIQGGKFQVDSSYAALYAPHIKMYDKFNDYYFYASPEGFAAAVISKTAANYEIWYPPAGYRRARILASDVYRKFTKGELDLLYDNGINCFRYARGRGIVLWGQKTLQQRPSALDRLNVRLLLTVIKPAITAALDDFVFEINDDRTRSIVHAMITSYMEGIKARSGVSDFYVICDETNNTPEDIDSYKMNVWLFVKPERAAEYINYSTIITRTGMDFTVAASLV